MVVFYFPTLPAIFPALILGGLFFDVLGWPSAIFSPILVIFSAALLLTIFSLFGSLIGRGVEEIKLAHPK
jgi:hypothetical protein